MIDTELVRLIQHMLTLIIKSGGAVWPTIFLTCSLIMLPHLTMITTLIRIAPAGSTHQA